MEKLFGCFSEPSVRLRAQPAILYYRVRSSGADDLAAVKNQGEGLKNASAGCSPTNLI